MASIHEILLRVDSESDDAERDLATLAAELNAFDAQEAEAELDIDAKKARAELVEMQRELRTFDKTKATAELDVDIADAEYEILALQRQLAKLDREDVEIDVEVNAQIHRDLAAARVRLEQLRAALKNTDADAEYSGNLFQRLAAGIGGWGNKLDNARLSLGPFSGSLRFMAGTIGVLIPLVVALASGLGALTASAASALTGVGALGIAAGSLLAPAILLGIGVVQRFKAQADKAGTAAHGLARAAEGLSNTFAKALGPGADWVMRGATNALQSMRPVLAGLKGEFTGFGAAVGASLSRLGQELSSPAWTSFFSRITQAATTATPILTSAFISFGRVLRNIATASMPFLMDAFRGMAEGLRNLARSTSDIGALRESIGGLVDSARRWLELGKQLGRVITGFFKAAKPAGDGLVSSLAKGAKSLADWLHSAEGTAKVRDFLDEMLPIVRELGNLFASLAPLATAWASLMAPLISAALPVITQLVELLTDVLNAVNDLPGPISAAVAALLLFAGPIGTIKLLGRALAGLATVGLGGLGKVAGKVLPPLGRGLLNVGRSLPTIGRGFMALGGGPLTAVTALGVAGTKLFDSFYDSGETITASIGSYLNLQGVVAGLSGTFATARARIAAITPAGRSAQAGLSRIQLVAYMTTNAFRRLSNAANQIGPAVNRAIAQAARASAGASRSFTEVGRSAVRGFTQAVNAGRAGAAAAARGLAQAARNGAQITSAALRAAGQAGGRGFAAGIRAATGAARGAASTIANAARSAAQAASRALTGIGTQAGQGFARGIAAARGAAQGAGQALASAAASAMQAAASTASAAGAALANNFAAGIRAATGAAVAAAQQMAAQVRAQLPGSEPKDPASPLRGLGDAGRAAVENFARGIRGGKNIVVGAMRSITKLGPGLLGAISEYLNPQRVLDQLRRSARRIAQIQKDMRRNARQIERVRDKLGAEGLSDRAREELKAQLAALKEDRSTLSDRLSTAMGKVKDRRKEIADALRSVLEGALNDAATGVQKLRGLGGDLMEAIQRIFAEGANGFAGGPLRSGELAGSMVEGLPIKEWLQNLTGEIHGEMNSTLDDILRSLALGSQAGGFGKLDLAGVAPQSTRGGDTINYGDVILPPAPNTGGMGDPRIAAELIGLEMRRRGKAGRR